MIRPIPTYGTAPDRQDIVGVDPQTGDMMIRPLVQPMIRPAPAYNANALPFSPSRGIAPQQPVSPVSQLQQTAQAGLQGAERQQRTAQKLSNRVGGLLGGGETAGGLLSDIQGEAALQGLFATMQAIGRPVRRGEDRFAGATRYGMQVMGEAEKRGLSDLATRMKLDEYQRARDLSARRAEILAGGVQQPTGQAQISLEGSGLFTPYEINQMSEGQKSLAQQAVMDQQRAALFQRANMPDDAAKFSESAIDKAEQARRNLVTDDKRIELENKQRTEFTEKEYRPRAQAVEAYNRIAALSERGAGLSDYANLIAFIKTLDPTSVVREGEVALAGEFQTLKNRLETIYDKAAKGGFTDEFRRDLVETARRAAEIAADDYAKAVESQLPIIENQNLRPEQIIRQETLELAPLPALGGGTTVANPANSVRSIRGGRSTQAGG